MRVYIPRNLLYIFILMCSTWSAIHAEDKFSNSGAGEEVEILLHKMTLEEKIGQLNQYSGSVLVTGEIANGNNREDYYRSGMIGSVLNVLGVEAVRELQQSAVENTRLGIPLIFAFDVIHGYRTIFPIPLAESCSWDLQAIKKSARISAVEASASGINWTFAPMVDITRDPRWGRISEGAGEDPYLGSLIAAARVQGFQGNDLSDISTILACAKHFAAYGAAEAGRDYNTVDMSLQRLHEIYLPPFKAACEAGVATFMNSYNEFNGIPASANKYLLDDILRKRWGFQGFVVSDWGSFRDMVAHGYARDSADAALLALAAGSDMDMESGIYVEHLQSLVEEGRISEEQINRSVRRILIMKHALGLFDDPYRYCDLEREQEKILAADHLTAAREMARKSMVLLKNEDNLLPLSKDIETIAVIGPLADSQEDMLGSWPGAGRAEEVVSLLNGVGEKVSANTTILYCKGCDAETDTLNRIANSVEIAKRSDVVILAIGEPRRRSGEGASRAYLNLPGAQEKLVQAIWETGKPVVLTLFNGRPLVLTGLEQKASAILECWFPGTMGGHAVADILFGDYVPSAKLTTSFPYAVGQLPLYYNHKNTGKPQSGTQLSSKYLDSPNEPLYPFGFGLSYTSFEYGDIILDSDTLTENDTLRASVSVKNTGKYSGEEIVQLYIRDLFASVTRPVKELKGFSRITLNPGESINVSFEITAKELAFYTADGSFKPEEGKFQLFIGTNSMEVKQAEFMYIE